MVAQTLHFSQFHLTSTLDVLYRDDTVVPLEPQSVRVLRYLIEQRERVLSKDELLEKLWPDTFTTEDVLKKAISQARRALNDDANDSRFIRTWHGRGYQFIGDVSASIQPGNVSPVTPVAAIPVSKTDPDFDQLLGRNAELQMLCAEYRNALAGTARPVLVAGEPGIGKTQLARHFGEWVKAQGGLWLYGRFFDYDGSRLAPYETFLDLLRTACGISALDTRQDREALPRVLAERFKVRLPESLMADEHTEFPATFALPTANLRDGFATPQGDAFQAIVPLGQAFIRLSRQQPFVLLLDDLQWSDEGSRELLGWLMRNAEEARLLIVLLTRAEEMVDAAHPLCQWLKKQASYRSFTSLTLKPLDKSAFRQTIAAAFPALEIPPTQLRELQRVTGGNPYFLTEMLRLLAAENVIQRTNVDDAAAPAIWKWQNTEALHLPANLTLAAQAKLDRLSNEVRELAEQAAVIGDEFRLETLAHMTGRGEDELDLLLTAAVKRGVLSEHGVSTGEHFRFYHSILRRVLYERLTPRARARAHLRAAAAIEAVYAYESDRVAEAISAHYEQGSDWQHAYEWSLRAWQAARQRWQWNEAATSLERAWRAATTLTQRDAQALGNHERLSIQLGLGELYNVMGRFHEAESILAKACAAPHDEANLALVAVAQRELALTLYNLSRYDEAQSRIAQSLATFAALGDATGEARSSLMQARIHAALGNFTKVEQVCQTVLASVPDDADLSAQARGQLGWAVALQGRYAEAQPLLESALARLHHTGDLRLQAHLKRRLHWVHLSRGQYETSFQFAQRARDDYRTIGDASGEAKLQMSMGQVRLAQGLFAESLDYFQRTLLSLKSIGDRHCEAETLWLMGRAYCELQEFAQARASLTTALAMVRELGDRDDEFRVLTDLARLECDEQHPAEALTYSESAAAIAQALNNNDGLGLALVEQARARYALRQTHQAAALARQAVELLTAAGSGELWRAQFALGYTLQKSDPANARAALRETVNLLAAIHDQLSTDQTERRALIAAARPAAAQLLQSLR